MPPPTPLRQPLDTSIIEMIRDQFRQVNERITTLSADVNDMREELRLHPPCPTPGKCLDVDRKTETLFAKAAETAKAISSLQRRESWILGVAFCLSALLGGIATIALIFQTPLMHWLHLAAGIIP